MYTIAECDQHITQIEAALERVRRAQSQTAGGSDTIQSADLAELERSLTTWKRRKRALIHGPGPRMVSGRPGRW